MRAGLALPGQSGTVIAVKNVSGIDGSLVPLGIGVAARAWGLAPAIWLLLVGPVALALGLPRGTGESRR